MQAQPKIIPPPIPPLLTSGEKLFSLPVLSLDVPGYRGNEHTNAATLWRWINRGLPGADGPIKLDAVRIGNSWKTSREALARFFAKLTEAAIAEAVAHAG